MSNEDFPDTPVAPSFFPIAGRRENQSAGDSSNVPKLSDLPCDFGNFRLHKIAGRGGAGIVYRATDLRTDQIVAIKILDPSRFRGSYNPRFRKESTIHSQISSDYVVRHLEFDYVDDIFFIASEFVEGVSAADELAALNRDPQLALVVLRDLLRGLGALHEVGVIHRDVKPANLMLIAKPGELTAQSFERGKLTDFGLARQVEQTQSMELTRERTILGTPLYMAPEQYLDSTSVDARADIYSVGATAYHLFAGQPPFSSDDSVALAEKHRIEYPPLVSKRNAQVGAAIAGVIAKAMEKAPSERYQNAQEMLDDVERIIASRPISIRTIDEKENRDASSKSYHFAMELDATPRALWPLVSDTNRFNEAIGLPAPKFTYEHQGGKRKVFAQAKFQGMSFRWREHPFRWVVEREFSVFREFETGPFESVLSEVQLEPLTKNRTRLTHSFYVQPRGLFGRILTPFQFLWKTKRAVDRAYRNIEQLAQLENAAERDVPFGRVIRLTRPQKAAFNRCERALLERVSGSSSAIKTLAGRLVRYLAQSADSAVNRLRPRLLAESLGCSETVALELCLDAVNTGFLRLKWDVICPVCRVASDSASSLRGIKDHAFCEACNQNVEVDFANSVELVFAMDPELRTVAEKTFCIGGPYHAPHVLAQDRLLHDQQLDIGLGTLPAAYSVTSPQLNWVRRVVANDDGMTDRANIILNSPDDTVEVVQPGDICVSVKNGSEDEVHFRLERQSVDPYVFTANDALRSEKFRKQFPQEIRSVEQLAEVARKYIFAIGLPDAESVVDAVGELPLRGHFRMISEEIAAVADVDVVAIDYRQLLIACDTPDSVAEALLAFLNGDWLSKSVELAGQIDLCRLPSYVAAISRGEVVTSTGGGSDLQSFGSGIRAAKRKLDAISAGTLSVDPLVTTVESWAEIKGLLSPLEAEPQKRLTVDDDESALLFKF